MDVVDKTKTVVNVIKNRSSIGFCGALTLIFAAAKVFGFINWNWLWVLSPLWLPFAAVIGLVVAVFGIVFTAVFLWESFKILAGRS